MPEISTALPILALVVCLGYLLGSVPFGIVISRAFGLGDLRAIGSGNIGATNVLRTGNKPAAFLTLVLDSGKGAIAVLLARYLVGEDAAQLAGFAAFLGHCFPVWLAFKGGKGVATFLGTVLALNLAAGAFACVVWLAFAIIFRMSSLAGLAAAALVPVGLLLLGMPSMIVLTIALGALVWLRHTTNIKRILNGTETKIGQKS
ncbi:MAG: glycerol-3-phosphate 1-O-acyltransferase PlsY [Litoreibacter sp.]